MSKDPVIDLEKLGSGLQNNANVRRIYTALEANDDGSWDVVTVIETDLDLDPDAPGHRPDACDRLVQDIETGLRAGQIWGRVKIESL